MFVSFIVTLVITSALKKRTKKPAETNTGDQTIDATTTNPVASNLHAAPTDQHREASTSSAHGVGSGGTQTDDKPLQTSRLHHHPDEADGEPEVFPLSGM